jgi:hypothetical protein
VGSIGVGQGLVKEGVDAKPKPEVRNPKEIRVPKPQTDARLSMRRYLTGFANYSAKDQPEFGLRISADSNFLTSSAINADSRFLMR